MSRFTKALFSVFLVALTLPALAQKPKAKKTKKAVARISIKAKVSAKSTHRNIELPQAVEEEKSVVATNIKESFLGEEFQNDMQGKYLSKRQQWEAHNANYAATIHDRQGRPFAYSQAQEEKDGRAMADSFKKYALDKGIRNFMNTQKETRPLVKTVEAVENAAKVEVVTEDNWKFSSGLNPLNAKTFVNASKDEWNFSLDSTLNLYTRSEAPDYAISSRIGLGKTASEMNVNSVYNFSKEYQAVSALNMNSSIMKAGVTRFFSETLSTSFDTFYSVAGAPSPDQVAQISLNYKF